MKKKDNIKKIFIIALGIMLLVILAITCFYIHKENVKKQKAIDEQIAKENAAIEAQVKEKVLDNVSKNGYSVEFSDEKTFCFEKDDVRYFFRIDKVGVCFDNCKFAVEKENVSVKEGTVIITITNLGDGKVDVDYDDTRVVINDDGTEKGMFSGGYFICNDQFEDSSVEGSALIDGEQKARDSHYTITQFITMKELKDHYDQAVDICNQLNK